MGVTHKLGIIGFGGMGRSHFDHLTKNFDRLEIKGIYDISPKACEAAIARGTHVYSSLEDILQDPELDLILDKPIASSPSKLSSISSLPLISVQRT